jgi:hypothetical protein
MQQYKTNWLNMTKDTFVILSWNPSLTCCCLIKSIFNKIEQIFMNVYKKLCMQNAIWLLLQDDIQCVINNLLG